MIIPTLSINQSKKTIIKKYIPPIEILIWIIFIIWAIIILKHGNRLFAAGLAIILFIIVLWSFWYLLRDYISGIILKTGKIITLNQIIKTLNIDGKINKFNIRTLEVISKAGETLIIPYSAIFGKTIVKSQIAGSLIDHTFRIKTNVLVDIQSTINEIKKDIMLHPLTSVKHEPHIKPLNNAGKKTAFEITICSLNKNYCFDIEEYLKEKYLKKKDNTTQ